MKPGGYEKAIELDMIPLELNTTLRDNDDKYMEKNILMGLPLREAREIFEKEYLISKISRFRHFGNYRVFFDNVLPI